MVTILEADNSCITKDSIKEYLGHLLIFSCFKSWNEEVREFLKRLQDHPEAWDLQDYEIMTRNKFEHISSNLDIGETEKVR